MPNKMLIDATHPEETRVVVVRGNRVEEFDFESAQRKQLRGNIYLAKVTRVEPSLQAAFIEYGGNRHGFLAFSEIHPDYYQIPVADRQALIEADELAHREAEEESENRSSRRRSRHRNARRRGNNDRVRSEVIEEAASEPSPAADISAEHHDEHTDQPEAGFGFDQVASETPAETTEYPAAHEPAEAAHTEASHDEPVHDDAPAMQPQAFETPVTIEAEPATAIAPDAEPVAAEHESHDHDAAHDDHGDEDHHDDDHHDDAPHADDAVAHADDDHADDDDEHGDEAEDEVESVGGADVLEEVPERAFRPRRQYKIQEVIKRRQVMLVQVVKEERGNKGAALTTYLSLAGRYAVLMPNTARGGGISRKITSAQDRSRLKEVVQDLDVPEGMGVILRTAGAARSKPEIKRDFEYLLRMWETVRDTTLNSQAPTLVYEEGSLIKRSLRDLYNKEIDEVMVAGDAGYQEARSFMKMLMPSNVRAVKQYRDGQPLFSRMGVESQLDAMFSPTVTLKSGGYIVINQTEALVSIDVNSGRSTREHHIEDTALKTNLEAAEEVARQLRLRDLAGLIVIDFIDMDEKRNNRAVERKLSDCLRQDRARIQVGRISHFGLLEMSRQRIRASVLESSTEPCPHCGGSGHVRSVASVALQLLRSLEEALMKGGTHNLTVRTRTDVALYVLNHKRGHLRDLEDGFKVTLSVIADESISGQQSFVIDRGEQVHTLEAAKAILAARAASHPPEIEELVSDEDDIFEAEAEFDGEEAAAEANDSGSEADGENGPRRKRRRRRRGRGSETRDAAQDAEASGLALDASNDAVSHSDDDTADDESEDQDGEARADQSSDEERRPRRRGRRGGRRRRGTGNDNAASDEGLVATITDDLGPVPASEASEAVADLAEPAVETPHEEPAQPEAPAPQPEPAAEAETPDEGGKPSRRRSTVRERVSFLFGDAPAEAEAAPAPVVTDNTPAEPAAMPVEPSPAPQPTETTEAAQPKRGWWSRRSGQ
jgi:ribonuclease E